MGEARAARRPRRERRGWGHQETEIPSNGLPTISRGFPGHPSGEAPPPVANRHHASSCDEYWEARKRLAEKLGCRGGEEQPVDDVERLKQRLDPGECDVVQLGEHIVGGSA